MMQRVSKSSVDLTMLCNKLNDRNLISVSGACSVRASLGVPMRMVAIEGFGGEYFLNRMTQREWCITRFPNAGGY